MSTRNPRTLRGRGSACGSRKAGHSSCALRHFAALPTLQAPTHEAHFSKGHAFGSQCPRGWGPPWSGEIASLRSQCPRGDDALPWAGVPGLSTLVDIARSRRRRGNPLAPEKHSPSCESRKPLASAGCLRRRASTGILPVKSTAGRDYPSDGIAFSSNSASGGRSSSTVRQTIFGSISNPSVSYP